VSLAGCNKWLVAGAALAFVLVAPAQDCWVYFGTYTNALSRGIYVSRLAAATGKLTAPELAVETPSPCFLAVAPDEKCLYAANSVKTFNGEKAGAVSAFAVDPRSGRLTLLNQKSSGGAGPCHVGVDATGKVLFVANYGGGSVKSFLLATNGRIGADGSLLQHSGSSMHTNRQAAPHAHFITADPSNRFALACDLGTDRVMIYTLNPNTAALEAHAAGFSATAVPPGSGARHLAFSRDGRFVHVLNELACTVTTFAWDGEKFPLAAVETVSALPPDVAVRPNFTAAEILVHPSGKFVYATVRGHDSVSVLTAASDGRLTLVQNVPAGGQVPRGLGIDPAGRWLVVANQASGNVVAFAIDAATGLLATTGQTLKIGAPVDVKFVPAE
jgi:6-phosphogluconolactonase